MQNSRPRRPKRQRHRTSSGRRITSVPHQQQLEPDALTRHAEMARLDRRRFGTAIAERTHRSRVQEHRHSGEQIGLRASPGFFLNGKLVDASFGLEHREHAVRAALGEE